MSWADRMQQQHNEANNPRVEEQLVIQRHTESRKVA